MDGERFFFLHRAGRGRKGVSWGIPPPRGTGRPSLLSSSTSSSSPQKHTGRAFAGRHRKVSCFHRKWNLNGNQPMESGDPRVDGERVFPQVLLQVIHPAFPVTGFFFISFSLWNFIEWPRTQHCKWFKGNSYKMIFKKAEFVSCRYFPFTQSSGTTTSWCCNSSSSTLKISRPQKVTTSIILNHLKWW